jgi:hypothetical protein
MAMYDPGTLYVDPILTNMSVGFQDQTLYGGQIMPFVDVRTQSGRYRVFDRSNWLIFPARREPGTEANEVRGRKWSQDTFNTKEHSLQAAILDEERQELTSLGGLADPVFGGALQIQPEVDATELVTRSLLLEHELKVSTVVRDTTTYPAANVVTLSGTSRWNNHTYVTAGVPSSVVSDPVSDIHTGMLAVWGATRRYPNTMIIPRQGVWFMENHPRIVDRFKNFSLQIPEAFRLLTGYDGQILLVDSMYNSADNLDDAPVMTSFWGYDVWLGIVDPNVGLLQQTFGKTFSQIYPDGSTRPTDRWRENGRKADVVRTSMKYDLKVVQSYAGYIIKTAFDSTAFPS